MKKQVLRPPANPLCHFVIESTSRVLSFGRLRQHQADDFRYAIINGYCEQSRCWTVTARWEQFKDGRWQRCDESPKLGEWQSTVGVICGIDLYLLATKVIA